MPGKKLLRNPSMTRVPERLTQVLAHMKSDERALVEAIFQNAVLEPQEIEVLDLWVRPEVAVTYWILLLSGVNQEEEIQIAQSLLSWQMFFSKHAARVICIQSSERAEFRCCSSTFDVVNHPTLIFSDSPVMSPFIKVEPELLFTLANQKGGLQRFFTKIHSLIENGESIGSIEGMLVTEKFWRALKLVYDEVKGFISFSVKKDI